MRLALVAALVLVAGCDSTDAIDVPLDPPDAEAVPFRMLATTPFLFEPNEPRTVALRSEAEEAAFLDAYPRLVFNDGRGGTSLADFPEADYAAETVVVSALGSGSSSTVVRVDSVRAEGDGVVVFTTVAPSCGTTLDVANVAVVAAVEGPGREVAFAEPATAEPDCDK